jgi:hypothetical protein
MSELHTGVPPITSLTCSQDQYPVKKVKAQHNNEQFDMDTESGEDSGNDQGSGVSEIDDEQRAGPEPASEWIA